jgi:pimeloyl-ACP methyl ester carboxylesterase
MPDDLPDAALPRRHLASTAAGLTMGAAAAFASAGAMAQAPAAALQPAAGVTARLVARWEVERLNRILATDTPAFAGLPVTYTPARNAVRLYRVSYPSFAPERGNRPVALTGLLALPEAPATRLPLVSYQHGTVYGRQQVPSFPEQSPETQLMIAQFAGQGYALIGADYVGMGESAEPQGYMVKGSHQQATADLVTAARALLAANGLADTALFLAGWSQGGYVTMAMLERLEQTGVAVRAAATASAPIDPFATLAGFLNFPRPNDADWLTTLFILASFSFENYYGLPGLARSVLRAEHYDLCRRAYEGQAVDPAQIPTRLRDLVAEPYFDPGFFAQSAFGRLLAANHGYRWVIRSAVRNFYGEADEAIRPGIGRMAMDYQRAMGNDRVEAVSTGPTTHRGTFARAVPAWKSWFDGLAAG